MLTRRALLGTAAAGLVAAGCDQEGPEPIGPPPSFTGTPPSPTPTTPTTIAAPRPRRPLLQASFNELARFHALQVVAERFVLASTGGGRLSDTTWRSADLPAPFVAIEVDITRDGDGTVTAGFLTEDDRRGLRVALDPRTGDVAIEVVVDGETSTVANDRGIAMAPGTVALVLCENRAAVLVRPPGGAWAAVLTVRDALAARIDFRRPQTLRGLGFAWGARGGTVRLAGVRAGLFGMTGLRDPHLVQHADGTPYVVDGMHFLTWTCAGPGFFQQAHWGVFAFEPDRPDRMHQVAQIYTRRDGLLLGDHAGQLVRDGDRWLVLQSSWGDFDGSGVHVRHGTSDADLLDGVHVVETEPTPMPTDLATWDPSLTRIDGTWWWAYVQSPSQAPFDFRPALARAAGDDPFGGLIDGGDDPTRHQTEGTILARDRERWLMLASDGDERSYPVYDLSMTRVGRLDAPYGTNIPHPQVLVRPDGRWLMVTFDATAPFSEVLGYGGHGDVVILAER